MDNLHDSKALFSEENPWRPDNEDEVGALLCREAVQCCTCLRVIDKKHVSVRDGHVFCPDHQKEARCSRPGDHDHHNRVGWFLKPPPVSPFEHVLRCIDEEHQRPIF